MAVFKWAEERFWKSTPEVLAALWDEYLRLNGMSDEKAPAQGGGNIVYRGGKAYRKVDPAKADWA